MGLPLLDMVISVLKGINSDISLSHCFMCSDNIVVAYPVGLISLIFTGSWFNVNIYQSVKNTHQVTTANHIINRLPADAVVL